MKGNNNSFGIGFFACAALLVSGFAGAVEIRDWDRPIQGAEMKIIEASGDLGFARQVEITQLRHGETGIEKFSVLIDGVEHVLKVTSKQVYRCGGAERYVAEGQVEGGGALVEEGYKLILMQSKSLANTRCILREIPAHFPTEWKATLIHSYLHREKGVLELEGQPAPIYTIQ